MSTTVFPGKMLAITASAVMVLFIVGFLISGKQPVQSQQPVARVKQETIKPAPVTQDLAANDTPKPSPQKAVVIAPVKKATAVKHKKKANYTAVPTTDTSVVQTNKPESPVGAKVDNGPTPLDEMLVMGMNAPKKPVKDEVNEAHPKSGWEAFDKYLKMEAVSSDDKTGMVSLSFTVNGNGSLGNFKIVNSLSTVADKKAINLIKNGCAWAGDANKQTREVSLTVEFHKL